MCRCDPTYKDLLNNMTIKKIIESTIVASIKLLQKCSTKGKCLNFPNTLIATPFLLTKKLPSTKFYPSVARPSLLLRPAAFRPLLTEGLALSGKILYIILISLTTLLVNFKIFIHLIKNLILANYANNRLTISICGT